MDFYADDAEVNMPNRIRTCSHGAWDIELDPQERADPVASGEDPTDASFLSDPDRVLLETVT